MEGNSARPSPTPVPPPKWNHDVFVSFRGGDTRKGFMSHLFRAFESADIRCYRDTEPGQRGLVVGSMLQNAIRSSRIALVLFSAGYGNSKWCLDELVEIMKCADMYRDQGHMVLPIFYCVEPRDIRRQTAEFGHGFERRRAEEGEDKAEVWRAALEEAGMLSGWHLKDDGDESALVKEIVERVVSEISFANSSYSLRDAVGSDTSVRDVISLLRTDLEDVRVIGLFGIKGIGKTTLAKLVYSRVFREFGCVSFLENIGHAVPRDLIDLQMKLMNDLLKKKHTTLDEHDLNWNIGQIRARLSSQRTFIVLDDVRDKNHVASLGLHRGSLGGGSRILITTQSEQLLDDMKVEGKYLVSGLSLEDSLRLFSRNAFCRDDPEEGHEELSKNLVHYAGGLPLAVKTLGSCIFGKNKDQGGKLLEKLTQGPNLDWIGAYSGNPDSFLLPFLSKVGPYGGQIGSSYDDKAFTGIRAMRIVVADSVVQSISIDYDQNGSVVHSCRHGGGARVGRTHTVILDYPDEFVTSISGRIAVNNTSVVQSLSVISNRRAYGPYGKDEGDDFSFQGKETIEGGKILGFFGKNGTRVHSIGAYYGPASHPYPFKTIGSFGRQERTSWNDGKHLDVRQIDVVCNSEIESVGFIYDNYGHPTSPFTHGEQRGGELRSIKLNYPYEYLTSISGYLRNDDGKLALRSLSFHSNIGVYGPFGEGVGGIPFSGPSTGGKIVGFYGSCSSSDKIASIGAYLEPVAHIHPIRSVGPFGGYGGNWWDDEKHTGLRKIIIRSGIVVHSIICTYDHNGASVQGLRHGGGGGDDLHTVELDFPDEYVTSFSGYMGQKGSLTLIKSLTFQSNRRSYGPYGKEEGSHFESSVNMGKLIGFYGRSGLYLDSIGAYFGPVFHKDPIKTIALGPYGGQDGWAWDDGRHTNIRKIFITSGSVIDGIVCDYDEGGKSESLTMHGGQGGNSRTIQFDYPSEYLVSVAGETGNFNGMLVVRSLTLRSNKKTYGPFGTRGQTPFSFPSSINGKIVGFFGRSDRYIISIGAHLELFPSSS